MVYLEKNLTMSEIVPKKILKPIIILKISGKTISKRVETFKLVYAYKIQEQLSYLKGKLTNK